MVTGSAALLGLIALMILTPHTIEALFFWFRNDAQGTFGGDKFDQQIGKSGALAIMDTSTKFIWNTFHQNSAADRKNVERVALIVENMDGAAHTTADEIHLNADYIGKKGENLKADTKGILYHEMTHVWQWNGRGKAPSGLIEGIADYVRLTGGLMSWASPGSGDKWDEGYTVTAFFLQYCESVSPGFVANINAKMASGWDLGFFDDLTGKSVDQLWSDYKAMYASST